MPKNVSNSASEFCTRSQLHTAYILYKYIEKAMSEAVYEKIDDEYVGKIPCCWGVIAFVPTLEKCKDELLSVLEDWILVGLRLGHPLPVVGGIDPNKELSMIHGTKHSYMVYKNHRLTIPNDEEYSVEKLRMMVKEIEVLFNCKISADEWNNL